MEKEIYILRHGQTDFNKQGIVQGRGVNSDLNAEGYQQAQLFYEAYQHLHFDKVYTSTLKRTHQTVQKFIDKIPHEQFSGLDELAWGTCEGKPINEEIKQAFSTLLASWKNGDYDAFFEGGESPNQVTERVKEVFEIIKSRENEKRILICTHGRVLRIMLCLLFNTPLSNMEVYGHENTGLYRLKFSNNNFSLLENCSVAHLSKKI